MSCSVAPKSSVKIREGAVDIANKPQSRLQLSFPTYIHLLFAPHNVITSIGFPSGSVPVKASQSCRAPHSHLFEVKNVCPSILHPTTHPAMPLVASIRALALLPLQ